MKCSYCKTREAEGVFASTIAPFSDAICRYCMNLGVEHKGIIEFQYDRIKNLCEEENITPTYECRRPLHYYDDDGTLKSWDDYVKERAENEVH